MKSFLLLPGRLMSPRSYLFPIFFLLFSAASVQAKTVVIGTGSGFMTIPDMTGLNPGDVLAITPGQYSGAAFTALNGITIINNGGTVIFTGQVTLNTLVECVFSGFQFKNVPDISIRWDGNSRRCVEKNIFFTDCAGNTNDASDYNIYNGDTSSLKLYMCTFDSLTLFRSGLLLMGGWGEAKDLACYMDSIVFSRIKIDSTLTNGNEVRGIIFRFDAHDWKVTYKGTITLTNDVGIFLINGNGSVHNLYRTGGRGYILRIVNVGLKVPGNTYYYNNIDLNSTQYGSLDTRVDPVEFTQYTTGGNCYIYNNTAGNKEDHIGYWSSVAVVGTFSPPWVCEVKNNLGFNLQTNGKPPITMNQSSGTWVSDSSNNMYFDKPDGVVDPVTGVPVANSPVLGKGLTLALVQDDYYHNPRIGAYDIGAVQHGGAIIPPPPNQPPVVITGAAQTITLPVSNTTLDGTKTYDPDGSISRYAWTLVSGTGGTLVTPSAASTVISGLTQGTYIYKLTVTDNNNDSSSALDTVIVNPAGTLPNQPPVANAGNNLTITAPVNSIMLNGSSSFDPDGTIVNYNWNQVSGPSTAVITDGGTTTPTVSSLIVGSYVFQLMVTDNSGSTNDDQVTVTVQPPVNKVNQMPVAVAGADTTIYLPVNVYLLNASASYDPNGNITSYQWQEITGPNTAIATAVNSSEVDISDLQAGLYQFRLTVTDNQGATATSMIKITVDKESGSGDQLALYPNPAHGEINSRITSPVNGTIRLNVYDMNGRTVLSDQEEKSIDIFEKSLNVSALASGMYTIQVNIANMKTMVAKFIKQ